MQLEQILKQYWGFDTFRPIQKDIINSVLAGQDTLALMPTGGGKSLCFQVPGLAKEGVCLVISPLIALMKDQVENLKKRDIPAAAIYSGMNRFEIDMNLQAAVDARVKFLYLSPERLKTSSFKSYLEHMPVSILAIDEAHCISQWGYDFRPPYLEIGEVRPLLPNVPVIALTASATEKVQKDIMDKLRFPSRHVFQLSFSKPKLSFSVFEPEDKEAKLLEILNNVSGPSVVYASSRKQTKEIALHLFRNNISADYYHAGLTFQERNHKQDRWMKGQARVMVATNAFGMGIDKADVRTVVHMQMPASPEAYYQEAGRAGRDEKKAYAVLLYRNADSTQMRRKIEASFPSVEFIRKVYQCLGNHFKLAAGSGYLESFDFDLESFEKAYQLPSIETYYALKKLEWGGFIQLNESFFAPSRVMIVVDHNALYAFQVAHAYEDAFIKTLLRTYGGEMFSNFVAINEKQLARLHNCEPDEVVNLLERLQTPEMLEYEKQKDKPQVVFTQGRLDAAKMPFNTKAYEALKQSELSRLRAVENYVTESKQCRQVILVEYFGESSALHCGICDNCLEMNKRQKPVRFEFFRPLIKVALKRRLTMLELAQHIHAESKDELIAVINFMIEDKKVFMHSDGRLSMEPQKSASE